ncbi:hypothetical protein [Pseudomonas sp. TWI929]|uniref:hypothetical protein n=1 Tax=Pseudomonas sp. TWI929 TaxID=3136795 RepID=UPI00320AFC13
MQSESEELDKIEIQLKSSSGDYRIPGFSEGYALYLKGCKKGAGYTGGFLLLLGFAIAALAIGALVFGPSTITYYRSTGPSWFQYVQMYAAPIMMAGGALFTLGGYLYSKKAVGREEFLVTIYKLIAPDGQVVTGTVHLRYLGGDNFNIAIN